MHTHTLCVFCFILTAKGREGGKERGGRMNGREGGWMSRRWVGGREGGRVDG